MPVPPPPAAPTAAADAALARAAAYLWSRQAADGGWHSGTYGLLRSGQSLTAFVLDALLRVPADVHPLPADRVDRALEFLRRHTDADGAVGRSAPDVEDYPNYATALTAQAMARAGRPGWREAAAPLVACLRRQQFTEALGWAPSHPAYGGWGMGGAPRRPPFPGHVDLSMTRHVLEALEAAGVPRDDPALAKARVFLARCQDLGDGSEPGRAVRLRQGLGGQVARPHLGDTNFHDGGFIFTPTILQANKAGCEGERCASYGTATADGALALLAAGVPGDDPRVRAASAWLAGRHRADGVPGLDTGEAAEWGRAMSHYYAAAAARAFARLAIDATADGRDWREPLAERLVRSQAPDGSWTNPAALMKEDDPLIATPLALSALVDAVRNVQGSSSNDQSRSK